MLTRIQRQVYDSFGYNLVGALLALLMCGLLTGGCDQPATARTNGANALVSKTKIAVLPFENLSGDVNAGLIVSEGMTTSLLQLDKDAIMPPDQVRKILSPYEGQYLPPEQLGQILGADVVITGTVKEFRYVYGAGEQPVISFSVRLLSTPRGAVIWTRDYNASGKFTFVKQASLGAISAQMCQRAASDLQTTFAVAQ